MINGKGEQVSPGDVSRAVTTRLQLFLTLLLKCIEAKHHDVPVSRFIGIAIHPEPGLSVRLKIVVPALQLDGREGRMIIIIIWQAGQKRLAGGRRQ